MPLTASRFPFRRQPSSPSLPRPNQALFFNHDASVSQVLRTCRWELAPQRTPTAHVPGTSSRSTQGGLLNDHWIGRLRIVGHEPDKSTLLAILFSSIVGRATNSDKKNLPTDVRLSPKPFQTNSGLISVLLRTEATMEGQRYTRLYASLRRSGFGPIVPRRVCLPGRLP